MVRVSLKPLDASIAMLDEFMWWSTHDLCRVRLDWRANDTKKQAIVACRCLPLLHLLHSSTSCDLFIPLYIKGPLGESFDSENWPLWHYFCQPPFKMAQCILLSLIFVTSQLPLSLLVPWHYWPEKGTFLKQMTIPCRKGNSKLKKKLWPQKSLWFIKFMGPR
jgi:hypothetical protein